MSHQVPSNRTQPHRSHRLTVVAPLNALFVCLLAGAMGLAGCKDSERGMRSLTSPSPEVGANPALEGTRASQKPQTPTVTLHTASGLIPIAVEVANTPETRRQGLMYRESMGERSGMVFVFDGERDHQFWMENTLIPLDMLFITKDFRVAGIVHSATPKSRQLRGVGKPSLYVLEVNGGAAKRWGVTVGDRVQFDAVF